MKVRDIMTRDMRLLNPNQTIREAASFMAEVEVVMSKEVLYCFDTDEIDDVARNMGKARVRRLPVVNRDKRLVGIVSLGDLARNDDATNIGQTVTRVSTPGGKHDQTTAH